MAYDVFISHSSKDKTIADAVTASLEQAKIRCWIAPRDIRPGDSWGGAIVEAIESCRVMVVVFSAQSNSSKQVMREVERAVQHDIVVVPYRIEDVQPTRDMEYFLSSTHWLDAVSPELDAHLQELKATVSSILGNPKSAEIKSSPTLKSNAGQQPNVKPSAKPTGSPSPSKLPILLTGLALVFVLGFISFSVLTPNNDGGDDPTQSVVSDRPEKLSARSEGDIKLLAPDSVQAGATVSVSWKGDVAAKDYIVITPSDAADHLKPSRKSIGTLSSIEHKVSSHPGKYQIRFFDAAKNTIIARKPLTITTPSISLEAPAKGKAGSSISVAWVGPNKRGDYLAISTPESPSKTYVNYAYIAKGSPTNIRLPDTEGKYELRYVSGDGKSIWFTTPIEVDAVDVSITKLEPQVAGAEVLVSWSGPANKGDYLTVAEDTQSPKEYFSYRYVKAGEATKLRLPAKAGIYQIRYISGQNKTIWANAPVEIQMPTISITAPKATIAGTLLKLKWEGPANRGDYISIAETETQGKSYLTYRYLKANTQAELKAPQAPGEYVIRYVSGADNSVWYESPISVTGRSESLSAPDTAIVAKPLKVSWENKGQQGEYVGIYPKDAADDGAYQAFAYTNNKVTTNLKAPKEAGDYEIRYMSGNKKIVWARKLVTVTAQ